MPLPQRLGCFRCHWRICFPSKNPPPSKAVAIHPSFVDMKTPGTTPALKRAELLGTAGVFALGIGLGVFVADALEGYALLLIIGGGFMHGLAMYGRHRSEIAHGTRLPAWYRVLYWSCWVLLAGLAIWLAINSL